MTIELTLSGTMGLKKSMAKIKKPVLRFPGGKSKYVDKILRYFNRNEPDYREPFIGGGSVFLASEFKNSWINDIDPAVYDLWRMVQSTPNDLIDLIKRHTPILDHQAKPDLIEQAMALWQEVKNDKNAVLYPKGYRFLFLNKTCFNGVQSGGPTGGNHQTGRYNLMSRWSHELTISRILSANESLSGVKITNAPYEALLTDDDCCIYLDPPYLHKGSQCYDFAFTLEDHQKFASLVSKCKCRYVVTVDDCVELRQIWNDLVPKHLIMSETWTYSMSDYRKSNRHGKEMFIVDQKSFDTKCSKTKKLREYA